MKNFLTPLFIIITAVLLLLPSCGITMMEEGETVNEYIYPYIEFIPLEGSGGCTAFVVSGAKPDALFIPASIEIDGVVFFVVEFGGFRNPGDGETLRKLTLESSDTSLSETALVKSTAIEEIIVVRQKENARWGRLEEIAKDGLEFDGWYIKGTGVKVEEGDRMISGFTTLEPRWKEHILVYHEEVNATCTKNGTKACYICEGCGRIFRDENAHEEISAEDIVITASHSLVYTEAVAATCTEDGNSAYYRCTVCHMCFSDSTCENFLDEEDTAIRAKGHSLTEVKGKAATCTEDGFETYYRCSRPGCGKYFSDSSGKNEIASPVVITASGHNWSESWETDENDHWHRCLNAGCQSIEGCEEHSFTIEKVTKDPTYMEAGEKTLTCNVCAETKTEEIPPTGGNHTWEKERTVPPTCTERGYTVYGCTEDGCGATYNSDYVNATGHTLEEVKRVEPKCTESGSEACWKCSVCRKYFSDSSGKNEIASPSVIPATGHNYEGSVYTVGETTHSRACVNPGCSAVEQKPHDYQKITEGRTPKKSQTCTEGAVYTTICVCGKEGGEFTSGGGSGHLEAEKHEYTASTCTVQGNKTYYTCSRKCCSDKFYEDEAMTNAVTYDSLLLPLADHVYTKKQFRTVEDRHYYICDVCGKETKSENHTKTYKHDYERQEHCWECGICGYKSSWEKHTLTGDIGSRYCIVCGYSETETQDSSSGFSVNTVDREPHGTLTAEQSGTVWTFTLTSTNENAPPDTYMWFLEGEEVEGETANTFVLDAPDRHTYRVMCVFSSDGRYSSESMTINGGE